MYLVMLVVFLHKLFRDNPEKKLDPFGVGHVSFEVEILHVHRHVSAADGSGYDAVPVDFYCGEVCGGNYYNDWVFYQVYYCDEAGMVCITLVRIYVTYHLDKHKKLSLVIFLVYI